MNTHVLSATAIRTSIFNVGDDLYRFLTEQLTPQETAQSLEGKVLAITSKIISIAEQRLLPKAGIEKLDLIRRESDVFICETSHGVTLTIKSGLLIPSAGIDESNSETGHYILYPKDPFGSAERIYRHLQKQFGLKKFGVVVTDSHTQPLRRGVTGIALSHWGFKATRSLVGEADLFGRKLKMTSVNVVDSLASAAVYVMGEAAECRPLAIVQDSAVEFLDSDAPTDPKEIQIPLDEDLYGPLLTAAAKLKHQLGGG